MSYISDLRKIVGHQTLIMPCACVLFENDQGQILLQKRMDDGKWGTHGGAVEIDESVQECLQREIREELNLTIDETTLLGIYSGKFYHHVYPNGDHVSCIDIVYVCHKYHGEMKLQKEEVSEVKWFSKEDLPDEICDNSRQPIKDYFHRHLNK